MDSKQDILHILYNNALDACEHPNDFFESAIGLIQYEAVQKKIEFDGYFREKFEIEAEHPITFDDDYFENEERSELYVYYSALVDQDIFDYVAYVWKVYKNEELTENILNHEISVLKQKGLKF